MVDNIPVEYFADTYSELDLSMLGIKSNSGSIGQQAFEAFALLVAMRLWLPQFSQERVTVTLGGDNIAALTMVAKMQPKSKSLAAVARELALDIASASYVPDFVEHVHGITNGVADTLSRKFQAGKSFTLPNILLNACEVCPQLREASWWLARPAVD